MKTPSKLIRRLEYVLAALVILLGCGSAVAQPVKVGDLLTFNDGTKGVVCYVDPGNNQKGWVVALSPLTDKKFKNVAYNNLYSYNSSDLKMNGTVSSAPHGKVNTHILTNNDDELDDLLLSAGSITWYIPDAIQLMRIVGQYPILQQAALQAGGDLIDLITYDRSFWTSSKVSSENKIYCLTDPPAGSKIISPADPNDQKYLLLVRDFDNGNVPSACWKFGDNCLASKTVAPSNDTTFMGLIRYQDFIDTIYGNMAVILPIRDTLPEYIIPEFLVVGGEYTAGGVTFTGITGPGTYFHNDTLPASNGCDSIATKVLTVKAPPAGADTLVQPIAVKKLAYIGTEGLQDGEFQFTLRPIGANADFAPMPANSVTTADGRFLTVTNIDDTARFFANVNDGLLFSYNHLKEHFSLDELIDGVTFEYQMEEVLPTSAVNMYNGYAFLKQSGVSAYYQNSFTKLRFFTQFDASGENFHIHLDAIYQTSYVDENGDTVHVTTELPLAGEAPVFHNARFADTSLLVIKKWEDSGNENLLRPSEVVVTLFANDALIQEIQLNESNNWRLRIDELPTAKLNNEFGLDTIWYTVEEERVLNYQEPHYTYDGDSITVTNALNTGLVVTKNWIFLDDEVTYPDSLIVGVFLDGTLVDSAKMMGTDATWTHTFWNLPETIDGLQYTVKEKDSAGNWISEGEWYNSAYKLCLYEVSGNEHILHNLNTRSITIPVCANRDSDSQVLYDEILIIHIGTDGEVKLSFAEEDLNELFDIVYNSDNDEFALTSPFFNDCAIFKLKIIVNYPVYDTLQPALTAFIDDVISGEITVNGITFTGITGPGTYYHNDTLPAANGCDSIATKVLEVTARSSMDIIVQKYWFDNENDGNRPSEVKFVLFSTSGDLLAEIQTVTLTTANVLGEDPSVWSDTIRNLPIPDDETSYFVSELDANDNALNPGDWFNHEYWLCDVYSEDNEWTFTNMYVKTDTVQVCVESDTVMTTDPADRLSIKVAPDGKVVVQLVPDLEDDYPDVSFNLDYDEEYDEYTVTVPEWGCEFMERVRVEVLFPVRDTLLPALTAFIDEVISGEITVNGITFTGITGPGTYYHSDTTAAANGCDSIATSVLEVTAPITHMDIAIVKYWVWNGAPADERPQNLTLGLFTSDTLVQEVVITGSTASLLGGGTSDEWHDTLRNIPIYNDLNEEIVYEMREKSVNDEWLKEAGNTWYNSHYILRDIGYNEPSWMNELPQFYFENKYFSTDPDTTFVLCTDDEHATAYITREFDDWETSSTVTDTLWTITLTPEGEVSINTYDLQHIREMFSYIDGAEVIGVKNYDPETDLWTLMYKEITSGEYLWSDNLIHRIRVKTHLQTHDTSVVIVDILHDGYLWHDSLYKEPGHHTVYTHKANGCPLSDKLKLEILHVEVSGGDICAGDSTDLLVSVSKMGTPRRIPSPGDVLCTDGTILHPDSFLQSGKTAMGVVVLADPAEGFGRAVSLSIAYDHLDNNPSMFWATTACSAYVESNTTVYDYLEAFMDMDGEGNTERMLSSAREAGVTNLELNVPAARNSRYYDHRTYTTCSGNNCDSLGWYLPALGEMKLLHAYRVEVNNTLRMLRRLQTHPPYIDSIIDSHAYWSSTKSHISGSGHYAHTLTGESSTKYEPEGNIRKHVRPMIKFPLPEGTNSLAAQVGDLMTFPDGSQGIVCYVDPNDNQKGWVVDLYDIEGTHQIWNTTIPIDFSKVPIRKPVHPSLPNYYAQNHYSQQFDLADWIQDGKGDTDSLLHAREGYQYSPAADTVHPETGWYIPDAHQLMMLMGMVPVLKPAFERAGVGDIAVVHQDGRNYWSSTRKSLIEFFFYKHEYQSSLTNDYQYTYKHIRRVRDFDNSSNLHAYWAIQPKEDSIRVSPETTTVYDALVIYNTDTFTVQQTVNVYPIEKITLYDTVNYAGVAFDTTIFDHYTFRVTGPGNDTLNDTLQTHLGCDSIVTVILTAIPTSNTMDISVTKVWMDDENVDARPSEVKFALLLNGEEKKRVTLTAANALGEDPSVWSDTIKNLPIPNDGISYSVRELDANDNALNPGDWFNHEYWLCNVYSEDNEWTFTNRCVKTDTVQVCVESDTVMTTDPEEVLSIKVAPDGKVVVQLDQDKLWADVGVTLSYDEIYDEYTVTVPEWGCEFMERVRVEVLFPVRDTLLPALTASIDEVSDGSIIVDGTTFTGITGPGTYYHNDTTAAANGCDSIVTKVLEVTPGDSIEILVEKVWHDQDNNDGFRPDSLRVNLVIKGGDSDNPTFDSIATVVLRPLTPDTNIWYGTFGRWPKKMNGSTVNYDIQEPIVPEGYTKTAHQFISDGDDSLTILFGNHHYPVKTFVLNFKHWNTNGDPTDDMFYLYSVNLYRSTTTDTFDPMQVPDEGNDDWEYVDNFWTINNLDYGKDYRRGVGQLPAYSNGTKIHYAFKETQVQPDYLPQYPDGCVALPDNNDSVTIINNYVKPVSHKVAIEKELIGRRWLNTDTFAFGLFSYYGDTQPMPANTDTVDGNVFSPLLITNSSSPVSDGVFMGLFDSIIFHVGDLGGQMEKTFVYLIRELTDTESGIGRVPNVTYGTEEFKVTIDVKIQEVPYHNGGINNADTSSFELVTEVLVSKIINGDEIYVPSAAEQPRIINRFVAFDPVTLDTLHVLKKLLGRDWMSTDTFEMAFIPTHETNPMPADVDTVNGIPYAPLFITMGSTFVSDSVRQGTFAPITFTTNDMAGSNSKTFTYHIRELTAAESNLERIVGVTYGAERYQVDITVGVDGASLVVQDVAFYPVHHDTIDGEIHEYLGEELTQAPMITNRYRDSVTVYHLVADKQLTVIGLEETLQTGDYLFVMKPVGVNAAKAPLPQGFAGTGANRTYTTTNEGNAVRFFDDEVEDDGLRFDYEELIAAGFTDEQLIEGIEFEYEMHEVIPDGATFNNDGTGTWTRTTVNNQGIMVDEIFDGVVHFRDIHVRMEEINNKVVLHVFSTSDDHFNDYYLSDTGDTTFLDHNSPLYTQRHGLGGVPIFHNARIARVSVSVEKHWNDLDNALDTRPESITVTLMANGVATDSTALLNEDNGWTYTFENLKAAITPIGLIEYSVQEAGVPQHYTAAYSGNMADGFRITNTLANYGEDTECTISVDISQLSECPDIDCSPVTDDDGNIYQTVKIDGYCWMAENLRTQTPNAMIYKSTVSPDEQANLATYGYLYTWHDAAGGIDSPVRDENGYVRGICPNGWHLPTEKEINVLRTHTAEALSSDNLWVTPFGNNSTGFNALPAGTFNYAADRFQGLHTETMFMGDTQATAFHFGYFCCKITANVNIYNNGASVRCVKDCE